MRPAPGWGGWSCAGAHAEGHVPLQWWPVCLKQRACDQHVRQPRPHRCGLPAHGCRAHQCRCCGQCLQCCAAAAALRRSGRGPAATAGLAGGRRPADRLQPGSIWRSLPGDPGWARLRAAGRSTRLAAASCPAVGDASLCRSSCLALPHAFYCAAEAVSRAAASSSSWPRPALSCHPRWRDLAVVSCSTSAVPGAVSPARLAGSMKKLLLRLCQDPPAATRFCLAQTPVLVADRYGGAQPGPAPNRRPDQMTDGEVHAQAVQTARGRAASSAALQRSHPRCRACQPSSRRSGAQGPASEASATVTALKAPSAARATGLSKGFFDRQPAGAGAAKPRRTPKRVTADAAAVCSRMRNCC